MTSGSAKPPANMARDAFWGQMSEAPCRRAGKPVKERPMTVQRPSSGGKIRRL